MKINEAKQAYSMQLNILNTRKRELKKTLKQQEESGGSGNFDTVQITKELEQVNAQYKATHSVMESILLKENMIQNAESAKQQGEAASKQADEMSKCLVIYRRIASGGKVPAKDERKLMEYSSELYMAAKNMAFMAKRKGKEYDSLWKDEEESGEAESASEIAGDSEINVPSPEALSESMERSFSVEA